MADSESFPRIQGLVLAQKRAEPELSSLVPKKGPVLTRLGGLVSETSDLRKASSTGGSTQDRPLEVPQDPNKGKDPQVSGHNCVTSDHCFPPDTRAQVGSRGKRPRPSV